MDSLVASYASSDEEDDQQQIPKQQSLPSSLISSPRHPQLPSSSFPIPAPKRNPRTTKTLIEDDDAIPGPKSFPVFSSIPQPKSNISQQSAQNPKRIVQLRRPINPIRSNESDEDDDTDDEEEKEKKRKKSIQMEPASHSSLGAMLFSSMPGLKNPATLGALPSSGSNRRSIIEAEAPSSTSVSYGAQVESGINQNAVNQGSDQIAASYELGTEQNAVDYTNYPDNSAYAQNGDASGYVSYDNYVGQYPNNWVDKSGGTTTMSDVIDIGERRGKRGRHEIPKEIIEVKQDELMKNRPREDQIKSTGIAFGPAYRPAASSSSSQGKPTKLHKRKHQINSLFFDLKSKEMELAERRSRGLLTKAETQAKYGW